MQAPALKPVPHLRLKLSDVFRSEVLKAKRLGYTMEFMVSDPLVSVRLLPKTQRTIALARENGAVAIESTATFLPGQMLDATRDVIESVLQHAETAAA